MTLQELITDLKAAGANENTVRLAMNCYELGQRDARSTTWTQTHWTEYELAIAAAEREACAKVAKTISDKYGWGHYGNEVDTADEIAAAILARGAA